MPALVESTRTPAPLFAVLGRKSRLLHDILYEDLLYKKDFGGCDVCTDVL